MKMMLRQAYTAGPKLSSEKYFFKGRKGGGSHCFHLDLSIFGGLPTGFGSGGTMRGSRDTILNS